MSLIVFFFPNTILKNVSFICQHFYETGVEFGSKIIIIILRHNKDFQNKIHCLSVLGKMHSLYLVLKTRSWSKNQAFGKHYTTKNIV